MADNCNVDKQICDIYQDFTWLHLVDGTRLTYDTALVGHLVNTFMVFVDKMSDTCRLTSRVIRSSDGKQYLRVGHFVYE